MCVPCQWIKAGTWRKFENTSNRCHAIGYLTSDRFQHFTEIYAGHKVKIIFITCWNNLEMEVYYAWPIKIYKPIFVGPFILYNLNNAEFWRMRFVIKTWKDSYGSYSRFSSYNFIFCHRLMSNVGTAVSSLWKLAAWTVIAGANHGRSVTGGTPQTFSGEYDKSFRHDQLKTVNRFKRNCCVGLNYPIRV